MKARWSGKGASQYNITLRIVGNDDLGIVNNITSIISKEEKIVMKSINIDSHDGLFRREIGSEIVIKSRIESWELRVESYDYFDKHINKMLS